MASKKEQLQKRKAREKQRVERGLSRRRTGESALAYAGNKYKNSEYVEVILNAEIGIYEAFVITRRALTDHEVQASLEAFIGQLRRGDLPPLDESNVIDLNVLTHSEVVCLMIRQAWERLFQEGPRPGRDALIGVLRTLLHSISVWKTVSPVSRGYLRYLGGFLKKVGFSCDEYSADGGRIEEPAEHELVSAARAWANGVGDTAREKFESLAQSMLASGQAELVAECCQQVLGECAGHGVTPITDQLGEWIVRAQQAARPAVGHLP